MRACVECAVTIGADSGCQYGTVRAGHRTESCCRCAKRNGWNAFEGFACSCCKVGQYSDFTKWTTCIQQDAVPDAVSAVPMPDASDFGSAVRLLRLQRQHVRAGEGKSRGFKRAFEAARLRKIQNALLRELRAKQDSVSNHPTPLIAAVPLKRQHMEELAKEGVGFAL